MFVFFFLMIRRPPRSTPFPTRRSSDLWPPMGEADGITLRELRVLDGPNLYFTRPAIKLTLGVGSWLGLPDERAKRLARRSEEHTSELQSPCNLVCRLLLEKKKKRHLYHSRSEPDSTRKLDSTV